MAIVASAIKTNEVPDWANAHGIEKIAFEERVKYLSYGPGKKDAETMLNFLMLNDCWLNYHMQSNQYNNLMRCWSGEQENTFTFCIAQKAKTKHWNSTGYITTPNSAFQILVILLNCLTKYYPKLPLCLQKSEKLGTKSLWCNVKHKLWLFFMRKVEYQVISGWCVSFSIKLRLSWYWVFLFKMRSSFDWFSFGWFQSSMGNVYNWSIFIHNDK